jgi:phage shock protein A
MSPTTWPLTNQQLTDQLAALKSTVASLRGDLTALKATVASLQSEVAALKAKSVVSEELAKNTGYLVGIEASMKSIAESQDILSGKHNAARGKT